MSWPPKTSSESAGNGMPPTAGVSVSSPVGETSFLRIRWTPASSVVARPPRAPISQTPVLFEARLGMGAMRGSLLCASASVDPIERRSDDRDAPALSERLARHAKARRRLLALELVVCDQPENPADRRLRMAESGEIA